MELNPTSYTYSKLRQSARRRGIPFLLTVLEWERFCEATGYLELRGRGAEELSVDRIDEKGPYAIWNIQALSVSANVSKGNRARYLPEERRQYFSASAC